MASALCKELTDRIEMLEKHNLQLLNRSLLLIDLDKELQQVKKKNEILIEENNLLQENNSKLKDILFKMKKWNKYMVEKVFGKKQLSHSYF